MRNAVLHCRGLRGAAGHLLGAQTHELGDKHGIRFVVSQVCVVNGARVILDCCQLAGRIEPAAQREGVGRAFGVPSRFLVAHPLHAHRAAEFVREKRGFEANVVRRRAAIQLRTVHVDYAHAVARQSQKLRHTVAQSVRLHVVGVDRHLLVGRIGQRMRGANGGVSLKRHLVHRLDDLSSAGERSIGVARDLRLSTRRGSGAAYVVEQRVRRRERRRGGRHPIGLQQARAVDRLLLALEDHGHVVATAHNTHEARKV